MTAFLNTSNYSYTYASAIPVVQQIVGPLAFLKNVIGLVKDVANAIFSSKSFTTINAEITEKQNSIRTAIRELEAAQEVNKKNHALTTEGYSNARYGLSQVDLNFDPGFQKAIMGLKSNLEKQQEYLQPLSCDDLQFHNRLSSTYDFNSPMWSYDRHHWVVQNQIIITIRRAEAEYALLEVGRCMPLCERLHNIAISILTTIPVVGTIYNGISLYYIPAEA